MLHPATNANNIQDKKNVYPGLFPSLGNPEKTDYSPDYHYGQNEKRLIRSISTTIIIGHSTIRGNVSKHEAGQIEIIRFYYFNK